MNDERREFVIELNPGKHVCIVSTAHLSQQNPVYHVHEKLILVLVVDRETGVILECDVNVVCNLTRQFIQKIYCGKNLMTEIDEIRDSVQKNYFGASAKSLTIASKAARAKYMEIRGGPVSEQSEDQ